MYAAKQILTILLAWFQKQSSDVFCKKGVLWNFAKFTRKHLCQSLFFSIVAGHGLQLFQKRGSGKGVFLWIFRNFLEHLFLQNISGGSFCDLLNPSLSKFVFNEYSGFFHFVCSFVRFIQSIYSLHKKVFIILEQDDQQFYFS